VIPDYLLERKARLKYAWCGAEFLDNQFGTFSGALKVHNAQIGFPLLTINYKTQRGGVINRLDFKKPFGKILIFGVIIENKNNFLPWKGNVLTYKVYIKNLFPWFPIEP